MKLDDFYFVNENTGWLIRGIDSLKKIYKTTDGADTWNSIFENDFNVFRSIGFIDSLNGFVGTLDSNILMYTTNGGFNWQKKEEFIGDKPKGICGLFILDSLNIYGCGRYFTPAHFIKSSNGGTTWTSKKIDQVSLLVDCYFFNHQKGIIVGGKSSENYYEAKTVILFTSDGGDSWNENYIGQTPGEICWKIYFLDSMIGFVSVQSFLKDSSKLSYLKTINGGLTWKEYSFTIQPGYEALSIIFIDEKTGLIGGMRNLEDGNVSGESYITTNNGINWKQNLNYLNVNRFKYSNGNLFASGKYFYKIPLK
ncbi:MAG: hypothetical protein WAT71_07675 [Ignavibacteria bacterium]